MPREAATLAREEDYKSYQYLALRFRLASNNWQHWDPCTGIFAGAIEQSAQNAAASIKNDQKEGGRLEIKPPSGRNPADNGRKFTVGERAFCRLGSKQAAERALKRQRFASGKCGRYVPLAG